MDAIPLEKAKEQLEDLIAQAAKGEEVRITDPRHGIARLIVEAPVKDGISPKRVPGRWKGRVHIPEDSLLAPLSDDELAWLSGEQSP